MVPLQEVSEVILQKKKKTEGEREREREKMEEGRKNKKKDCQDSAGLRSNSGWGDCQASDRLSSGHQGINDD